MRIIPLLLAGAFSIAAGAAYAQQEPGRADTRIDNGTCYAKGLEAQRVQERREQGDVRADKPPQYAEQEFARKCGTAVTTTTTTTDVVQDAAPMPMADAPPPAPEAPPPSRLYSSVEQTGGGVQVITNGPVPDTPENRSRFGGPRSRAGKRTAPAGN